MLEVSVGANALGQLRTAALSKTPVSIGPRRTASPHEFYRYPARFSPQLASAAITAFSDVGDLICDPFVGGGTTLVEARLASRFVIGSDVNALATFVSKVKSRKHSAEDVAAVREWLRRVKRKTRQGSREWPADPQAIALFANFDDEAHCELRSVVIPAVAALGDVSPSSGRDLARCVLLRTSQWALDMRQQIPSRDEFLAALEADTETMLQAAVASASAYSAADRLVGAGARRRVRVLNQPVPGLADALLPLKQSPRLILTSPPYPGVYVNYHRWKIAGRRETPLPYFIAGEHDGQGLSYYTMSARAERSLNTYFRKLEAAFIDVARLCDLDTWLVQVVGFNDVGDQLQRYVRAMNNAGFTEVLFNQLATEPDGRLWRDVPGRRWWARAGARASVAPHTSREVVFVHRLAR